MTVTVFGRLKTAVERALGVQARRERRERALLLRMCFGDGPASDRLIARERSRNPGISEAEACRRAIRSYKRDNR